MKFWRSSEERKAAAEAQAVFEGLLPRLKTTDPQAAREALDALRQQAESPALSGGEQTRLKLRLDEVRKQTFRESCETILDDDILSIQEELVVDDLANAMGIGDLNDGFRDLLFRLNVARANDGRLAEIESPHLMTKGDEVVYLEISAALMKEVAIREYQGGYGGFSFRVAKGVRYHTGSSRGSSVVVGTELQVADTGVFSVSSTRAAYLGSAKSIEFPYAKLMGMDVFSDGLRLRSSNRQTTPLFRVENGDVVAATLNAAIQRFEEQPPKSRSRRRTSEEA